MKILSLIDQDVFIECIVVNSTNEYIEEIILTHNAFKAKDFTNEYENKSPLLKEISLWVYNHHNTLVEVKEIVPFVLKN